MNEYEPRWSVDLEEGLAKEIGVSPAALNLFERGGNCDADALIKILIWLHAFNPETPPQT